MKRFEIAPEARADLDGIWSYIARRGSAEAASKFLWHLNDTFASIALSPSAGVRVPDAPVAGTRKFPLGNYLIYYRPIRGGVRILRVVHGKRRQYTALRQPTR